MAKTLGTNPWVMTAAADAEGLGNGGSHEHPLYVDHLEIMSGNGGDILIKQSSSGKTLVDIASATADDNIWWDVNGWLKGIYITTLPTNGEVRIYLGTPPGRH